MLIYTRLMLASVDERDLARGDVFYKHCVFRRKTYGYSSRLFLCKTKPLRHIRERTETGTIVPGEVSVVFMANGSKACSVKLLPRAETLANRLLVLSRDFRFLYVRGPMRSRYINSLILENASAGDAPLSAGLCLSP